jgi:hypothetical protein
LRLITACRLTTGTGVVWFNHRVPPTPAEPPPASGSELVRPSRSRLSRRVTGALVALGVAGLALVGAVATASVRSGDDAAVAGPVPRFVDETATAGLTHAYDGEFEYFVGGGVAVFDCDDDGRPELFLAGGSEPAALFHNDSAPGGALRFTRVPSPVTDLVAVTGAYPLDIDSDRHSDLVVLRHGDTAVLRGLGGCRFEPFDPSLGLGLAPAWTTAFSATFEDGAALPTMAFGNYLVPGADRCDSSALVRPGPGSTSYAEAVLLEPGFCPLSALFSDWSRTGQRDLRLSNDRHYYRNGGEQLWRITPGQPPSLYSEADGWNRLQVWGMGIASHDLTGDGLPEVFLTSQGDNKLQTLAAGVGQPTYRDLALRAGVTAQRPFTGGDVLPSTAWHPEFADVNNDGLVDLLVTKGNVEAQPDHATRDPTNLLLGQPDGTFTDAAVEAGTLDFVPARGAALADLNLDGLLDLVVVHRRHNVGLWRNLGDGHPDGARSPGHWLQVRLSQEGTNPDAVGAWLDIELDNRTLSREVTVGGGHAGGQRGWLHTGLGRADRVRLRVQWPDGETGPWLDVDADRFVVIERGADTVTSWTPPG